MTDSNKRPVGCIACSIFQRELDALLQAGELNMPTRYLSSMLHMYPQKLERKLARVIEELEEQGSDVLLLYGECHNHIDSYDGHAVRRVNGCNCVEILLGPETFAKLSKEGAFFLLPEWALRWREVFEQELGLKGPIAAEFMKEMHSYLLYLDTELVPVPAETLDEASEALGLPWKSIPVTTEHLRASIQQTIEAMHGKE